MSPQPVPTRPARDARATPRIKPRHLLMPVLAGGLASAAVVALPSLSSPAAASLSTICSGYSGCADAGYGNGGYSAHNQTMYWNMYGGHNCTNYVAYRMIQNGASTQRPWNGSGNATYWGGYLPSITDQTPTVGSAAWFTRGTAGGSDGHVAYVEKVISPTQIVISEDSWSGDFHWAVLTKDGGYWPSGFIHFTDRKTLKVTTAPQIVGTPQVGKALTVKRGIWSSVGHKSFTQQWYADGAAIAGATGTTYTPTVAQVGRSISVHVAVSKPGYQAGTATAQAGKVARGVLSATAAPGITVDGTGTGLVGETLTATPGKWSQSPDEVVHRWKANGVGIPGATGLAPSLTLTPNLVGKTITVMEAAAKTGYARSYDESTAQVGPVLAGAVTVTDPFTTASSSGANDVGSTLTVTPGTVAPSTSAVHYGWLRDGHVIAGAFAASYHVGPDDFGHAITARARVSSQHYSSLVRNFEFGAVGTASHLHVNARQHKDGALIGVHVWAPGSPSVPGQVSITVGSHTVTADLVDGHARVFVPGLHPGNRKVEVSYAGTSAIKPSASKGRLTIDKVRSSTRIPRGNARVADPATTDPAATSHRPHVATHASSSAHESPSRPAGADKAGKSGKSVKAGKADKAGKSVKAGKAASAKAGTRKGAHRADKARTARRAERATAHPTAHATAHPAARHHGAGDAEATRSTSKTAKGVKAVKTSKAVKSDKAPRARRTSSRIPRSH